MTPAGADYGRRPTTSSTPDEGDIVGAYGNDGKLGLRSPLRVRRENVIFCRHRPMALVPQPGVPRISQPSVYSFLGLANSRVCRTRSRRVVNGDRRAALHCRSGCSPYSFAPNGESALHAFSHAFALSRVEIPGGCARWLRRLSRKRECSLSLPHR